MKRSTAGLIAVGLAAIALLVTYQLIGGLPAASSESQAPAPTAAPSSAAAPTAPTATSPGIDPPSILGILRAENDVAIEFALVARVQ